MNGSDEGNRNQSEGGRPANRHHRQASAPPIMKNINLGELGRQWSTGRSGSGSTAGKPRASFVLSEDMQPFAADWASDSGSLYANNGWMTSTNGALEQRLSSGAVAFHNLIGPRPSASGDSLDGENVSSIIHDEARIVNWDTVLSLCKSHPQHAAYAGPDGWTALHHACNRRCNRADVVEALIHAYPGALLDLEEKGMTPLHYACRFKAPREAVRLLLELYPSRGQLAVSKRDKRGRTPLWYAVRYKAPLAGVVEMLLDIDPNAVLDEDSNGDSPLALVWEAWAEKLEGKRTLQPYLYPEEGDATEPEALLENLEANVKLHQRWKTTIKLLRAAFRFSMVTDTPAGRPRTFRMVHATCAIKCHPTLFLLSKALYPGQAKEYDENDLYPFNDPASSSSQAALHLAAASGANGEGGRAVIVSLLSMHPEGAQHPDGTYGSLPLHRIAQNGRKSHWMLDGVKDLYQAFPRGVEMVDKQGRLPLHRAAEAITQHVTIEADDNIAECSVIYNFLQEYPEAASHRDNDGRLPLHVIAENGQYWCEEARVVLGANEIAPRVRAGPTLHNRLPVHLAAANPIARESLIGKLVELNPRGVTQADSCGKLPLHLACETAKTWDGGVRVIYDSNQAAIGLPEQNGRGWTALQLAAATRKPPGELITKLASLHAESASRQDKRGRYALHLACAAGKGWEEGVRAVFLAYPLANISEDSRGMVPFVTAALRCAEKAEEKREEAKKLKARRKSIKSREDDNAEIDAKRDVEVLFQLLKLYLSVKVGKEFF